ncbi:hypothetical protein ACXWQ3_09495, partial [Streptococcus pyogenes]
NAPAADDALGQHLRGQLSPETQRELTNTPTAANDAQSRLRELLLADFNRLLRSDTLYEPARFRNVPLSAATQKLIAAGATGTDDRLVL